jgi:hypothetical protein
VSTRGPGGQAFFLSYAPLSLREEVFLGGVSY